ncbi:hypothetical protein [Megasphaera vaginalis (ex Srinivasan et al. 2021)]|uniref:Uncharacterized protein n=1 Tax=Megasphaera vaginalis (ex Srinivasan et al. 2021) TaxID=1111454 RepID=U7UTU9_9FIRM|nr:hypothetical protein [Megasphaera vaginalis (ex Srinivasan et al. 2021)]ERT62711.1 hypothetical protein HMPREF1250_0137 [Megasphaera vaginalis (ex Srinivasan et al. 2021)]
MKVTDIIVLIGIISMCIVIDFDKEVIKGLITGSVIGAYGIWRYLK